jgi:YceI-like protein
MKTHLPNGIASASSLILGCILTMSSLTVSAQAVYQSQRFDIRLNGTSNVHDWQMKALKGKSEASFLVDDNDKVITITRLSFSLPATNLKSEHAAMDKNTYKALKTDKNPNISFVGSATKVTSTGGNNYELTSEGELSIAGTTKHTQLVATGKYNPTDKTFTITGVKKMKMTDYNVQPPKALMGTIKTGNDISISYDLTFSR